MTSSFFKKTKLLLSIIFLHFAWENMVNIGPDHGNLFMFALGFG